MIYIAIGAPILAVVIIGLLWFVERVDDVQAARAERDRLDRQHEAAPDVWGDSHHWR